MEINRGDATKDKAAAPQIYMGDIGVIKLEGKDALALVQRLTTGDVRPLATEELVRDTLFVTAQGRAFAWVTSFKQNDAVFLLVHPAKAAHLAIWLDTYTIMDDVVTSDVSAHFARAMVFGEARETSLASVTDIPSGCRILSLSACCESSPAPCWDGLAALGSPRVYLLSANERAHVGASARARGYTPLDEAALSQKMIMAGIPREEDELKDEVNPFEMRLGTVAISWNKGCYIGQEVLSRLDSYDKVARLTMGFVISNAASKMRLEERETVRLVRNDRVVGRVLSWTPHKDDIVGLALVKRVDATEAPVDFRSSLEIFTGHLYDRPFWSGA